MRGCGMVGCRQLPDAPRGCQQPLDAPGSCLQLPDTPGGCWQLPDAHGDCRQPLDASGSCCQLPDAFGSSHHLPDAPGSCRQLPDASGSFPNKAYLQGFFLRYLFTADECSHPSSQSCRAVTILKLTCFRIQFCEVSDSRWNRVRK